MPHHILSRSCHKIIATECDRKHLIKPRKNAMLLFVATTHPLASSPPKNTSGTKRKCRKKCK